MIDEDLRTFILGVPAVADSDPVPPVEKGKISEEQANIRIYYQRDEANTEMFLGGAVGQTDTVFTVEVAALDDAVTQTLAAAIKTALNGWPYNGYASSSFSPSVPLGSFVQDHNDDYLPKLLDADEGFSIAAFQVQVIQ